MAKRSGKSGRTWTMIAVAAVLGFAVSSRGQVVDGPGSRASSSSEPGAPAVRVDSIGDASGRESELRGTGGVLAGGGTYSNVGADECANATTVPAEVGLPGLPSVTTIIGDNTPATAPDCTGTPFNGRAVWWESFEITERAAVRLDLCGTTPEQNPSYQFLYRSSVCPTPGLSCGNRVNPIQSGRGSPYCLSDNNAWWRYNNLAPGIYAIPIYSDTATLVNGRGPYQVHITVEGFPGACCDFSADTCTDGVLSPDCAGPNQSFHPLESCCTAECLPPGEEYASKGVELLSRVSIADFPGNSNEANDVWGYTSPSGREYAIVGLNATTGFVDITDPFDPVIVADVPDNPCLWSDMKVYQQYAYNVTDCQTSGVQVFDLTDIDQGLVTLVREIRPSGMTDSHTITLNPDSGYIYLNGTNLVPGGGNSGDLVVLSLANPSDPTFVNTGQAAQSYVHDSLVVSYTSGLYAGREIAFCFCGGNGMRIVDVTNKASIFRRGSLTYPTLGYCHQGWLSEDRRYLFMNDEADESSFGLTATTYVINVENLDLPFLAYSYTNDKCHIDHDLIVDGPLVYKASYTRGLEVDDAINPLLSHEVAFFDSHPEGNSVSFAGVWGVYAGFPSGVVITSDMQRGLFVLNYDCNRNRIDDTLDIANTTSADCNSNGFPDECELWDDCNGNSIPDSCESPTDGNGNGVPDFCDCANVAAAGVEPSAVGKNRFLSLVPGNAGATAGIRVTLTNLPQFSAFNGQVRWVGPPQLCNDIAGGTYYAAQLQCTPYYQDWSTVGTLHVYGPEVVPDSTYNVQLLHEFCPGGGAAESEYTAALPITTNEWGDVTSPLGGASQPNFADVTAEVEAFQGKPTAPKKARSMLVPDLVVPGAPVNFQSVSASVAGFQGKPYPYGGPTACPP